MSRLLIRILAIIFILKLTLFAQGKFIPEFPLEKSDITLHRLAQPNTPFNKVGRRFAVLGQESGTFEAWAYPLKLFRNFEFSFLIGSSTKPILARDIIKYIDVAPEATTLTYAYQSFTIKATFITAINDPFAMILFKVDTTEPMTIICGFLPVLQPMWPAGIGGQSAYWNDELKAYQISEPTRNNTAYVGSPAASGISYTPAHMLSDTPNEFKIEIGDPHQVVDKYIPIYMTGSKGLRDSIKAMYKRLSSRPLSIYQQAVDHYKTLVSQTMQVITQDHELNLAFAWSKVCLDNMLVNNPDLGEGLIAGLGASGSSGRPGFGWFFGGDAFINSLALNSYGALDASKTALAFTQKWQRKDGKMAHELTQAAGYVDWFGKYPYGYIHGDTTPFFIVAMCDYYKSSADTVFIRQSWPALKKAFDWCLATDANKDGLIDNSKAGLGSVEYGALTDLSTDIYTGALSVAAFRDMSELAHLLADKLYEHKAKASYVQAVKSFDAKFWNVHRQVYANAFNDLAEQIQEVSPWIAMPAVFNVGDSLHNYLSMMRLSRADMTTDWGIRSISDQSQYYGPLNYNYGAVWPFLSGYVSLAQFNQGLIRQAFTNLKNIANLTFDNNLGYISELYSGSQHVWPAEAVSQQGFSSMGIAMAMVRGWLGYKVDAPHRLVRYEPMVVSGYERLVIKHPYMDITQSFTTDEDSGCALTMMLKPNKPYAVNVILAPHLWMELEIARVERDNQLVDFQLIRNPQSHQPCIKFKLEHPTTVTFFYHSGAKAPLFLHSSKIGESNQGLKLIDIRRNAKLVSIQAEGLSGKTYYFSVKEMGRVVQAENAIVRRAGEMVELIIADKKPGQFVEIKLILE